MGRYGADSTQTTAAMPPATASAVTKTSPRCSGKTAGRDGPKVRRRRRRHMGETLGMEDAFGIVLIVVVIIAALVAIGTFVSLPKVYDQIGRLSLDDGSARAGRAGLESAAGGVAERDEEIRQMLEARNARRARQGKEPIDIEAEIARLQAPAVDPALRDEIRQLVEARNARRVRQGKEPLDVEDEIERELRDLGR